MVNDRLLGELRGALVPGAGIEESGAALSRVIAPIVAHDGLRCGVMNPSLGVGISALGFWHGYGPDLGRELMSVGSFAAGLPELGRLARQTVPVGVVDLSVPLGAFGVGEELCLVLRDTRGVWGLVSLTRAAGGRPFDADDTHAIAAVGRPLIAALRGCVTARPVAPTADGLPPGMLVVGADGKVRAMTPVARQWLAAEAPQDAVPDWLLESFLAALSFEAHAHARDPRRRYPRTCFRSAGSGWTGIEAQPLGDNGDVAITVQRATGTLLLPTFCDWYQITTRERQVMRYLHNGTAPRRIARLLDLSVHTVDDYLKALFRKTGTCGRDELIAAINA
ncbi:helix-turn-helix transcriptional regulator [Streptomyces sp. NPDC050485]|uniref:helix-turn-helix transcriptional regulator n=1 Tax=Streptomyces sp. NPDC050485 TaxID=3365617 RepID=UPI0037A9BB1B